MTLQRIGFFSDLPHGLANEPRLQDSTDILEPQLARQLARYLRSGSILSQTLGTHTFDILESEEEIDLGVLSLKTDGQYVWPSDLAYYVEKYRVDVPEGVVRSARQVHWRPPDLSDEQLRHIAAQVF